MKNVRNIFSRNIIMLVCLRSVIIRYKKLNISGHLENTTVIFREQNLEYGFTKKFKSYFYYMYV